MRAPVRSVSLGGVTNLALMAPIRQGFVPGFEAITYTERLRRLLNALNSSRVNAREAELRLPVLPDAIGRFRVIRCFRYAIWPRHDQQLTPVRQLDGPVQSFLTLNVSFDGGWEPYMRVIYDDIGPLLDALLCHCEGYPGSRRVDFDTYNRWVRAHELGEGTFYNDAEPGLDTTAADARYLAQLERVQREARDALDADMAAAALSLTPMEREIELALRRVMAELAQFTTDPSRKPPSLALPLRTLKGLYRLSPLFPPSPGNAWPADDRVLRGFARLVLGDLSKVFALLKSGQAGPMVQRALRDELDWYLSGDIETAAETPARLSFDLARLQHAVLADRQDGITHGAVALLRVTDAEQAAKTLAGLRSACAAPEQAGSVRHLVGFTPQGLRALGLPPALLDALSPEFMEGMEARSSVLGDLRGNHPNQWRRPKRLDAPNAPAVEMSTVHVVVLLKAVDAKAARETLLPVLGDAARTLAEVGKGLRLLVLEPVHARAVQPGEAAPRDHFGFVDGLSQPLPKAGTQARATDDVAPGELVLGHANDRGDPPYPAQAHPLLDDGSYLVVRKLRQRLDHLEQALGGRADRQAVMAAMMGREFDGTPLVAGATASNNAFDFKGDPQGLQCPFQAHVRRVNPRDGRPYTPRILRRGMSWGPVPAQASDPSAERGILFMAFCASIAEQFETLQGWVAGANASGVSSAQADPFLAVPRPGEKRTFRYLSTRDDGRPEVRRVDLGEKPFVELQWGLYLFVPALAALARLPDLRQLDPDAPAPAPALPRLQGLEAWRERLEDQDRSPAVWAAARAHEQTQGQPVLAQGYGTLVTGPEAIRTILKDDGSRYSVGGYGSRMASTVGLNYLALDGQEHQALRSALNPILLGVSELEAHRLALGVAKQVLDAARLLALPAGQDGDGHGQRVPIDLVALSEHTLAALCTQWFGLPDGHAQSPLMVSGGRVEGMPVQPPPRCPGHLYGASRTIFGVHPNAEAVRRGQEEGPMVNAAVTQLLAQVKAGQRPSLPELADKVVAAVRRVLQGQPEAVVDKACADNLAGMLLGFPPTVHGNLMQVLRTWIDEGTLWEHQERIGPALQAAADAARAEAAAKAVADAAAAAAAKLAAAAALAAAQSALRHSVLATMRRCPIPETLWRTERRDGNLPDSAHDVNSDERLVLGIRQLMTDPQVADVMMFGGSTDASSTDHGAHACPGYAMGVGVMTGILHALLGAGTLRPTGSPVLLVLATP